MRLATGCEHAGRMVEGSRRARSHSQQQAAQCQWQQLSVVDASEWKCVPKVTSQSVAPDCQAAKGRTRPNQVIAAESAPCDVLVGEGACWAIAVAAAGASTESVPPTEAPAKPKRKRCRRQVKLPAAGTAIDVGDGGSYTSDESPRGSGVSQSDAKLEARAEVVATAAASRPAAAAPRPAAAVPQLAAVPRRAAAGTPRLAEAAGEPPAVVSASRPVVADGPAVAVAVAAAAQRGCPSHARRHGRLASQISEGQRRLGLLLRGKFAVGASLGSSMKSCSSRWSVLRSSRSTSTSRERRSRGNPESQCLGHREGKQNIPALELPTCVVRVIDERAVGGKKSTTLTLQAQRDRTTRRCTKAKILPVRRQM